MLLQLLADVKYESIHGNKDIYINDLCIDSRKINKDDMFICIEGNLYDGHMYIDDVIDKGCRCIVYSKDIVVRDGITYIRVENTKEVFAYICRNYFNNPSRELKVIGVTGTKGKSSLAYMLYSLMNKKYKTGLIGSMGIDYIKHIDTVNTTPDVYTLNKYLREMVDLGYQYCIIEVSSLAVYHHRITGIFFDIGVLTNIGSDHISESEHKDINHYKECKYSFLRNCNRVVLNRDDSSFNDLRDIKDYMSYSIDNNGDITGYNIKFYQKKYELGMSFYTKGLVKQLFYMNIPGYFNIYNILAVIGICSLYHIDINSYIDICIKGRCEMIKHNRDYSIMIDYAHNELSFKNLIEMIRSYKFNRIIMVYGAGGNRDKNRRYNIGKLNAFYGVYSVVTMDNPRNESVDVICGDIVRGIEDGNGSYCVITDRRKAIEYALDMADSGDIVVLAGKGGENYMIVGDCRYKFDERAIIFDYLNK